MMFYSFRQKTALLPYFMKFPGNSVFILLTFAILAVVLHLRTGFSEVWMPLVAYKLSPIAPSLNRSHDLFIYELYYSNNSYPHLHKDPPFKGVSVVNHMTKPGSHDIDAAEHLPKLKDSIFQSLICEFGAMLALQTNLEVFQEGAPWIGFQSWRAKEKGLALEGEALRNFQNHLSSKLGSNGKPEEENVFYYWATMLQYVTPDLYESCAKYHSESCPSTFSTAMNVLFGNSRRITGINSMNSRELSTSFHAPLPQHRQGWAYCSYWVMHVNHFQHFMTFARMYLVTLETLWDVYSSSEHCPLAMMGYDKSLCWCFVMERVVNIWVYHTGTRMFLVDGQERSNTGKVEEVLNVAERQMVNWFSLENILKVEQNFLNRLDAKGKGLYKELGGTIQSK